MLLYSCGPISAPWDRERSLSVHQPNGPTSTCTAVSTKKAEQFQFSCAFGSSETKSSCVTVPTRLAVVPSAPRRITSNLPFQRMKDWVSPFKYAFSDCVFDACTKDGSTFYCYIIKELASFCSGIGVNVKGWRELADCSEDKASYI